jgi:hypothetical protein
MNSKFLEELGGAEGLFPVSSMLFCFTINLMSEIFPLKKTTRTCSVSQNREKKKDRKKCFTMFLETTLKKETYISLMF